MKKISVILAIVLSTFSLPYANATATYEIIDLSYFAPDRLGDRREGWAFDINDNGIIVGEWYIGNQMYIDPVLGHIDIDLSTYGGVISSAQQAITGINNNNDLVAWNANAFIDGERYYGWVGVDGNDGSVSTLDVDPIPINYQDPLDIDEDGNLFLREYTGPTDLLSLLGPDSGWDRLTGLSMNIHGQIVGWGTPSDWTGWNPWIPFLMNPIDHSVPEPTSIALLGIALAGVGLSRRKKMQLCFSTNTGS